MASVYFFVILRSVCQCFLYADAQHTHPHTHTPTLRQTIQTNYCNAAYYLQEVGRCVCMCVCVGGGGGGY